MDSVAATIKGFGPNGIRLTLTCEAEDQSTNELDTIFLALAKSSVVAVFTETPGDFLDSPIK